MKKWLKILMGLALSLMTCMTCMGYAALTTTLEVKGMAKVDAPNAIYITDVSGAQMTNATAVTEPANIDFPSTKLLSDLTYGAQGATVTVEVTLYNGTPVDQIFDILEEHEGSSAATDVFDYTDVAWTVEPGQGTVVPAGQSATFTVTFTYDGGGTEQRRSSLYSFRFVMTSDDLTQAASRGVTDRLAAILNNELPEDVTYTYNGTTYTISKDASYEVVDDNMEGSVEGSGWNSTGRYMGNLSGADADDKAILTALFGDELTFRVGDEEVPITVMIKEKDVYGDGTLDMVLYITADDLSERTTYVPVYASVFSQDENGTWVQVGEIFAGEAETNAYSGWAGSGSFDTETWRSTESYYGQSTGLGIDELMTVYSEGT